MVTWKVKYSQGSMLGILLFETAGLPQEIKHDQIHGCHILHWWNNLLLCSSLPCQYNCFLCLGHLGKVRNLRTKLLTYYIIKEQMEKEGYTAWRQDKIKTANTGCSFSSFSCDESIGEIVANGFDMLQTAFREKKTQKLWSRSNKHSKPCSEEAWAGCAI